MSQIQTFQTEWERNQTQLNMKQKEFYETQPNQKAIEWLETQSHQKEWEHEKREKIRERVKNDEPIVVINHLNNSEHDILSMVHQVLTKNEFSDDSSIFVVVPSVDNDAGNSSDNLNSNVCMQMSENPITWKVKDNSLERDPKQHRNNSTHQGVKLFSKGKRVFMEGLPTDLISYHNKQTLLDRTHPRPKEDCKKATKNKLCQISTPNGFVERKGNRYNVVSVDTTVDRPCCCSAKTNQCSDYNSNNKYVARVMSNLVMPIIDKPGIIGKPVYKLLGINPRDSVKSSTVPRTPCNNQPCRPQRTQHTCAPTQQYTRALSQQHNRAPIQQLSCAPTHHLTWSSDQRNAEACPAQHLADECPTQHRAEACPTQHQVKACPTQKHAEAGTTCECSPELLLKLFKIAIKGGNWQGMPSFVCGECPEIPTPAPPAEPTPEDPCLCKGSGVPKSKPTTIAEPTCPCDTRSAAEKMQIEMGETKQKQGSIRQTRFNSTVGTSTEPKSTRKTGWWSWRKNICECPKEPEPKPEPVPEPKAPVPKLPEFFDPEPYLTLESYFQYKDAILSEEILKKNSLETERVSGFRLRKDKKEEPEPESDFTVEDAIRYLAMMNPVLFQNIMAEEQAKLDGTYKPPPPPPPPEVEPRPDIKEAGPFKGLKFKIGGKGSGSQGLAGVCCFDLLTESFTTW